MRPRVGVDEVRQLVRDHRRQADVQQRGAPGGRLEPDSFLLPHDHEHEPRPEALVARRRRRVEPREVGRRELDVGEERGLDLDAVGARLAPQHLARGETEDVVRPVQAHVALDVRVEDVDRGGDGRATGDRAVERAWSREGLHQAATQPREEGELVAHGRPPCVGSMSMGSSNGPRGRSKTGRVAYRGATFALPRGSARWATSISR